MKRIHLFEFEDLPWLPSGLRECMMRYLMVIHKLLGTSEQLATLLHKILKDTEKPHILDLCSGGGGPMPETAQLLKDKYGMTQLKLTLTDLYPNEVAASTINRQSGQGLTYLTKPTDASNIGIEHEGLRTMVCSMHHMKPDMAVDILRNAMEGQQPICIYEISDNSFPKAIWWLVIPINFISTFFITLMVRPMSLTQIVFTYLIPILPLLIAWDGAVSNARTYTLKDMDLLLARLSSENYQWEKGVIKGKGGNKLYLVGQPYSTSPSAQREA